MQAGSNSDVRAGSLLRERIVAEARSWIRTPYISNAMVKGSGVDCAMLLLAVYRNVGLLPEDFDPRPYPAQWHLHQDEERYLGWVRHFSKEFDPGEAGPLPGDAVLFRVGRLFAHGAIVEEWPRVIHARDPVNVLSEDISRNIGKHSLWKAPRRFFTLISSEA